MRIAIVGCGSRQQMYRDAITSTYAERHDLVALCDPNAVRLRLACEAAGGVTGYHTDEFDRMLFETAPDIVVVCTPDHTHADYIVPALDAGCDVICEKPLATTDAQLRAIVEAEERSGKRVTVTFNYRYTPARTQLKDLLMSGAIGEVTSVTFRWALDRVHGADYFRRWHRQTENSGGLFVHKASHHFDLLQWWLDSEASSVTASAQRAFYTPETADRLGLAGHAARCSDCSVIEDCSLAMRLEEDAKLKALYKDAEGEDGYHRDACVFADDIAIYDTHQAHIRYASGVSCNYSLVAYAPWEGFEVTFVGTGGELNHKHVEVHGIFGGTPTEGQSEQLSTVLHRAGEAPELIDVAVSEGDHGGGDALILEDLFGDATINDPYKRKAHLIDGIRAVRVGIAAQAASESGGVEIARADVVTG